jgi:hypothetical protein
VFFFLAPARALKFLDSLGRIASSLTEPDPSEPVCDRRIVTSAPFPTNFPKGKLFIYYNYKDGQAKSS